MLTSNDLFEQLSEITLRSMEEDNLFTVEILDRAAYSLSVALMMMTGDLSDLPTTED
tara:strand:+ start:203 stop:373 length:171 start_codon:yes stop_codon:yes gene_type:complete